MVRVSFITLVFGSTSPTPTPCHASVSSFGHNIQYLQLLYLRDSFFTQSLHLLWVTNPHH